MNKMLGLIALLSAVTVGGVSYQYNLEIPAEKTKMIERMAQAIQEDKDFVYTADSKTKEQKNTVSQFIGQLVPPVSSPIPEPTHTDTQCWYRGKYRDKPDNGECVNEKHHAWRCTSGYTDTGNDCKKTELINANFVGKCKKLGAYNCDTIAKVSKNYNIKPEYILTIGLTENILNPRAVGDNGCSFGSYQMNVCAGRGRYNEVWRGYKFKDCAKNPRCSTKRVAKRITDGTYGCNVKSDGTISNWNYCLAKHQGYYPAGRYTKKIGQRYYWIK